ncbi:DUF6260 family protein [bacterium]|nr:DUF6260 family protein [bacterium]
MPSVLYFHADNATNAKDKRIVNAQYEEAKALQIAGEKAVADMLTLANAAQTPAEAYREFDSTTTVEARSNGEFSTLTKLLQKGRPVSIGKEVFEHRKSSKAGIAQTSMSGQVGVKMDNVDYKYAGTVVPIHDVGFGRTWRQVESMRAEGFDALVDDANEAELTLMEQQNNYLWNGDANMNVKGRSWLGLKADPSIATATLGVDLAASASAAQDIQNEVKRVRDILRITNKCSNDLRVAVSQEIMSNWERPTSLQDIGFNNILAFVLSLRGIVEVYEDPELSGNQMLMYWDDQQGLHPVIGMAVSTYAVPRVMHNDDFNYVKWCATGWLAKTTYEGLKCAIYAS